MNGLEGSCCLLLFVEVVSKVTLVQNHQGGEKTSYVDVCKGDLGRGSNHYAEHV